MRGRISIAKIINTVAQFYKVSVNKLQRKSRRAKFTKPRHVAMYLLRSELNKSYPYIGRMFGGRDHTTAVHAYNKILGAIQNSPGVRAEIEQIKNLLYSPMLNLTQNNKINFKETKSNMAKQNPNNKRERFKRLAAYRTNEVLKKLKVLGNCANRSAYEYSKEEVNKIFSEIERKVREVKSRFHFPKEKEFKL